MNDMTTYYAVLMSNKKIDNGICVFKPEYLIEGQSVDDDGEKYFLDNFGTDYFSMEDSENMFSDSNSVGYIISEEDLLSRYGDVNIDEAKARYFDEITDKNHFGFYIPEKDIVKVVDIALEELLDKINDNNENSVSASTEFFEYVFNDLSKNCSEDVIESVTLNMKDFDSILESKSLDEMRSRLEELKDNYDIFRKEIIGEDTIINEESSGNELISLFNESYNAFLAIDDLEEMKNAVKQLENEFINLTVILDKKAEDGYDVGKAQESLYCLVDNYDEILRLNDLELIKSSIKKIKDSEFKNIKKIASTYDKSKVKNELAIHQEKQKKLEEDFSNEGVSINARDMKKFFDEKIIGQEDAKKDVISAIIMNKIASSSSNKNSCLLVGPTGSGKTLLAEAASEYLDMPIEIFDSTQLTVPGYVGTNIEDFLARLLSKTQGDLLKAEEGIVVFDEIDKKGSESNSDVSGKGVLDTLLPFMQGTVYDVKYKNKSYQFDTSKLTFFATGAFTDVAKGKKSDSSSDLYKNHTIGFNVDKSREDEKEDIKYEKLEIEDFVKYGKMPIELMGRFSTIAQLTGHTKESLRQILTKSNQSALLSEAEKLDKLGVNLKWTDDYLDKVAEKAIKLKTGGRSLKTTVEKSVKDARWEVLSNPNFYSDILLTKDTVDDSKKCKLICKTGEIYNLDDIIKGSEEKSLTVVKTKSLKR